MLQVTDKTETKKGSCDLTESLVASYLGRNPRSLPSTLLWDDVGLDIYEQITQSPDYYLTRAESEIIRDNVQAIVAAIGANGIILEMGSGCDEHRSRRFARPRIRRANCIATSGRSVRRPSSFAK
jgi:uncharacterized SAM-dependent methyltransferase